METHVIDDHIDTFHVNTTTKDVSRHQDTLLKVLESLVSADTLLLVKTRVNSDRGEVALSQQTVELVGTVDRLDKDADLVEFELVEQVVELAVLGVLGELDKVLLETVQGELGLVIDVDFKGLPDEQM